ncbi:hypothetical protein [Streptomyces sp. NPDC005009]
MGPADRWRVWGGYYEEGTLIRVSRWVTADSVIECRDALAMPAAPDRLVLLRRMRVRRGQARLRLTSDPRPGFGADRILEDGERVRPACTVTGGTVPEEHALGLLGDPGGGDRVGNQAATQFQLDTFGEALQLFAAAARHDRLPPEGNGR